MGFKIVVGPFAWFKWEALFQDFHVFLGGFLITLLSSILALLLAMIIGLILGVCGASHYACLKRLSRVYVGIFQNTPLVIQVFFLYHGLPHVGIMLPVLSIGVLGVGSYHGAYIAEVVRAGIQSVPKGQKEAAFSQGFGYYTAMRHIILPQAMKIIFPPLTNQAVSLIKNTSVLAMIAGGDLMYSADSWSSSNVYYGPAYVVTGILYLSLCLPLARFARRLEGKPEVSV